MIGWLTDRDAEELRAVLAEDTTANLFALGMLEAHGVTGKPGGPAVSFLGIRRNGALAGAVFIGGLGRLVVPCCADPADAEAAGRYLAPGLRLRILTGERRAADALHAGLGLPAPRLRRDHRLFRIGPGELGPFVSTALRLAGPDDLEDVVQAGAAMHREELGRDPLAEEGASFRSRISDRIAAGRSWLVRDGASLAFRVEVGIRCRFGAQLDGVYTPPAFRRRGLALLGLGQLCRTLLASTPQVTLHAHEANEAAVALYRKLGFAPAHPFRLLVAD